MKFIFIDESEKQRKKNRYFFILCGLIIDERGIFGIEEIVRNLKENYNLKNLKDLKSRKIEKQNKLKISENISNLLKENRSVILSTILGSITLQEIKNVENSYFNALTFMIERFFLRLKKEDGKGMIIHDSIEKNVEGSLRKKLYKFITSEELLMGTKSMGRFISRIYPSILFSNDEYSEILQVTDLIATSLNSAVWNCLEKTSKLSTEQLPEYNIYLKIYWPLFDRNPRGKVDGWGIKVWW